MTSYKDLLVLLNDLEEYTDDQEFPEAEKLIAAARKAIEKDLGGTFPAVRKSPRTSVVYMIQ
ncbi:hypothetical protein AAFO92_19300 [Roseovarius sp. CAU 1744]|uniref:hypothetical protein n=1 Tax=Roseovarius sp. CAU 1744 TaxID=3140368 RepID=UPI00325C2FFD